MILQVYLLTIGYLLLGAGALLVDEYGGQYILLLRLRHNLSRSSLIPLLLCILGLSLSICKVLFPVSPGPVLIGDFVPVLSLAILATYHATQSVKLGKARRRRTQEAGEQSFSSSSQDDMLQKTGTLIETHKRNLGFFMLFCAVLHFLFPGAVLL
ncbi:MAG: hypothetical protein PHR90_02085 [Sphaerochaetaceae bacterium]|nr:hypothetical protein [Sphaerochaetaceae bacterium]